LYPLYLEGVGRVMTEEWYTAANAELENWLSTYRIPYGWISRYLKSTFELWNLSPQRKWPECNGCGLSSWNGFNRLDSEELNSASSVFRFRYGCPHPLFFRYDAAGVAEMREIIQQSFDEELNRFFESLRQQPTDFEPIGSVHSDHHFVW